MLVPLRHASDFLSGHGMQLAESGHGEPLPQSTAALFIGISAVLVALSGLMSGLTISLLAMDEIEMEVLKRGGTTLEKKYAVAIAPLLENHHLLLCTLVVWNAFSMEALPIFLDRLADPFTAVLLSVTVVLFFGEIVPQSICTHYGLAVGYYASGLLRLLMILSSPIAWPLSKLLDALLGHSSATLPRRQLQHFVSLHSEDEGFARTGEALSRYEAQIINCALEMSTKAAAAAMTPLDKVYMVAADAILDARLCAEIIHCGHSRVPVHAPGDRASVFGLLLVKDLVLVREPTPVAQLSIRTLPTLSADTPMWDVLQLFKTGQAHMAMLYDAPSDETEEPRQSLSARSASRSARSVLVHSDSSDIDCDPIHEALLKRTPEEVLEAGFESAEDSGDSAQRSMSMSINAAVGVPVGIITIEDVMEELLGDEIIDETDRFVDNMKTRRVDRPGSPAGPQPPLQPLFNWGAFVPHPVHAGLDKQPMLRDWRPEPEPLLGKASGSVCNLQLWRAQPSSPANVQGRRGLGGKCI